MSHSLKPNTMYEIKWQMNDEAGDKKVKMLIDNALASTITEAIEVANNNGIIEDYNNPLLYVSYNTRYVEIHPNTEHCNVWWDAVISVDLNGRAKKFHHLIESSSNEDVIDMIRNEIIPSSYEESLIPDIVGVKKVNYDIVITQ